MRLSWRYALLGVMAGLLAPVGLFAVSMFGGVTFDPLELFAVMALGGMATFALAGLTIGRRDEALIARNRELAALSRRFEELSAVDGLTGIPNRRSFDARLEVELARSARYGAPLALVMADIDHFKGFNDRHGHRAGDAVLRLAAAVLEAERRAGDMVARFGGEEFVAILPHTDAAAAAAWAERVRERLAAAAVVWQGAELAVTASFGLAAAPEHGLTAVELVERADTALYEAKRLGRNRTAVASPRAAA